MPPYITWFDLNKEVLSFSFSCKDVHLSHEHKSISSPREASEALLAFLRKQCILPAQENHCSAIISTSYKAQRTKAKFRFPVFSFALLLQSAPFLSPRKDNTCPWLQSQGWTHTTFCPHLQFWTIQTNSALTNTAVLQDFPLTPTTQTPGPFHNIFKQPFLMQAIAFYLSFCKEHEAVSTKRFGISQYRPRASPDLYFRQDFASGFLWRRAAKPVQLCYCCCWAWGAGENSGRLPWFTISAAGWRVIECGRCLLCPHFSHKFWQLHTERQIPLCMINATITAISLGKARSAEHSSNREIVQTENTTPLPQGRLLFCRLNSEIKTRSWLTEYPGPRTRKITPLRIGSITSVIFLGNNFVIRCFFFKLQRGGDGVERCSTFQQDEIQTKGSVQHHVFPGPSGKGHWSIWGCCWADKHTQPGTHRWTDILTLDHNMTHMQKLPAIAIAVNFPVCF